jgi:hypothetical protein
VAPTCTFTDGITEVVITFTAGTDGVSTLYAIEAIRRIGAAIARSHSERRMASLAAGRVVKAQPIFTPAFTDSDSGLRPALQRGVAVVRPVTSPTKKGKR